MREILFRGKRVDNGKWVYGSLFDGFQQRYISPSAIAMCTFDGALCLGGFVEVYPESIGQYTGLTDKNGKRIFEGDILRRAYHPNEDMIVEWHDGRFVFYRRIYPKDYGHESLVCCQQNVDRLSIIGNIHDNPELLED